MRNIFDQYEQPENRLTHALVASLAADRRLLRRFCIWVCGNAGPQGRLEVLEQSFPGSRLERTPKDETSERALPDAWIGDSNGNVLLIESKITAGVDSAQIQRHMSLARRLGFDSPRLLLLTVGPARASLPPNVVNRHWTDVYNWLFRMQRQSTWAVHALQYFEIAEVQADMRAKLHEGTLTRFTGLPFSSEHPYSYVQAKRLLGLLRAALFARKDLRRTLKFDPNCQGRGAITGKAGTLVWDYISLRPAKTKSEFTKHAHLSVGIRNSRIEAMVTIPNGFRGLTKTKLFGNGYENFNSIIAEVTLGLERVIRKYKGGAPLVIVGQRRYLTQRSRPFDDATLFFDPRTGVEKRGRRGRKYVKLQPQWMLAAFDVMTNRNSNLQFQIGAEFPYDRCAVTRTIKIVDAVAESFIACAPAVRALRHSR